MEKPAKPSRIKPYLNRLIYPGSDLLEFFHDMSKCGPVVRLPTSRRNYLINDPYIVQHILITNVENYTKEKTGYERAKKIVGRGMITNSGSAWAKRRQQLQAQFHTKNISQLTGVVNYYTELLMNKWRQQESQIVDISSEMSSLTMNISAMALLGIDLRNESHELVKYIHIMNNYGVQPNSFIPWLPSLDTFRFKKAKEYVEKALLKPYLEQYDTVLHTQIRPLLSELLARDENNKPLLTVEEYLGEAKNFFVAGHETTGNALTWTFYCLLHHPYVLHEIKNELSHLAKTPLNFEDLDKLPYLDMAISEAIRLFPPVWIIYRRALKDDFVAGYPIPADTTVTICPFYLHRDEKYWPHPRSFSPERFSSKTLNQQRPKCAYLPFGSGPRVCLGKQFAIMNMKLIITNILQNFDLQFPREDYYIRPLPLITLKPKKNIELKVTQKM